MLAPCHEAHHKGLCDPALAPRLFSPKRSAHRTSLTNALPDTAAGSKAAGSKTNRAEQGGSVYIILAEGTTHVKIGYSGDVAVRVRSFRTGNSHSLRILREIQIKWARRLEKTLHQRYARYCIHGDWFDLPPDILRQLLDEPFA